MHNLPITTQQHCMLCIGKRAVLYLILYALHIAHAVGNAIGSRSMNGWRWKDLKISRRVLLVCRVTEDEASKSKGAEEPCLVSLSCKFASDTGALDPNLQFVLLVLVLFDLVCDVI